MDQLARLGVIFASDGAQQLLKELNSVASSSKGAETATEQFTDSTKKAATGVKMYSGALGENDAHVKAFIAHQKALKIANDNAAKSTKALSAAGLNLGRQFSDVGVSLAGGINPLMVLIQQGPQIADGFAVASAAGLSFKAVLTGLWAQITPLIATFAPWIAGLAAVGAAVYVLNRAHEEHIKRIDAVNKSIDDMNDKLVKASPWLIDTAKQSDLAAEGTKNFHAWVEKNTKALKDYAGSARDAAIELARLNVWTAKNDQQKLVDENFKVVGGAPVYKGKGSGPFGWITGDLDKGFKEYEASAKKAAQNVKATQAELEMMLSAPTSAFGEAPKKGRAPSQKDKNRAAALADGRFKSSGGKVIDLSSIATVGQENYTPGHLNKFSPGGDRTIGGDPMVDSAEEASKKLQAIQDQRAKDRVESEKRMWDGLVALSSSGNKKLAAIGKAAAIAQATIDGINAVQKALSAFPPPFNIAAAALVGGLAAANVAKIAGVKGFATGGYTGDGPVGRPAGVVHGREFVVNAAATNQNRATLEAMNAGRAIPKNPMNDNGESKRPIVYAPRYSMGNGNLVTERVYADFDRRIAQDRMDMERRIPAIVAKHTNDKGR